MTNADLAGMVPRCSHGNIILGCPDDDCPEQNAYLADHERRVADYHAWQRREARRVVREAMGLPPEEDKRWCWCAVGLTTTQ